MLITTQPPRLLEIRLADAADRDQIFRLRHEVYAQELGQHSSNPDEQLRDGLDAFNTYIVAADGPRLAGFVSITPPGAPSWSIDKYFNRAQLGLVFDGGLYEARLLTVGRAWRGGPAAALLMHATLRWVHSQGGREIVIIGRRELTDLYQSVGFRRLGPACRAGAVTYELMSAPAEAMLEHSRSRSGALARLENRAVWRLGVPFRPEPRPTAPPVDHACDHGGAFFRAVGDEFDDLSRVVVVVNADVLDAWFPPAPAVVEELRRHLPWALGTSPPTHCEGLVRVISRVRGVPERCVVPGAGSSDLIFRALRHWLTPRSRAAVLDPTYGEYAHVLERVVGCAVDRIELRREEGFALDPSRLRAVAGSGYDLLVLVNPNNPTGAHIPRERLERALAGVPAGTRVWIDEAYVDYVGPDQSLERFAAASRNVVVCKSLSKVYALSGARAAYLVAPAAVAQDLRRITPPWAVGLPAQLAAVRALQEPSYYTGMYAETASLRAGLGRQIEDQLGLSVHAGVLNCVLCWLPEHGPDAAELVARCRRRGVFVRDCSTISPSLGTRCVRVAVKDGPTNAAIVDAMADAMRRP